MNFKELEALTEKQRQEKRKELELELMKERTQVASGSIPKNPGMMRQNKRIIARIKTIENQR